MVKKSSPEAAALALSVTFLREANDRQKFNRQLTSAGVQWVEDRVQQLKSKHPDLDPNHAAQLDQMVEDTRRAFAEEGRAG